MQIIIVFRNNKQGFLTVQLQTAKQSRHFACLWFLQFNIFHYQYGIAFCLVRKCRHFCKVFYFAVQLEIPAVGFWPEYSSAPFIQWVPDIPFSRTTGTFLFM